MFRVSWLKPASPLLQFLQEILSRNKYIFQYWWTNLNQKNCLIVGGASGIGLETARVLALRNAHVIIAARNMEAANEAKHMILKDNNIARVDVLKLDLASLTSVKAFADNFIALNLPLNILM